MDGADVLHGEGLIERGRELLPAGERTGIEASIAGRDGVGTWGRAAAVGLPADDAIWTMEVAPDDPKLIVASTFRGGVWRSVDGGASFQRTNNTWALDLQILPGGTVYVGGRGVFVSHDRGATFTGYQHSLGYFPTSDVYGLAADPRDPRHVAIGLFSFGFQAAQLGTLFHDPPV